MPFIHEWVEYIHGVRVHSASAAIHLTVVFLSIYPIYLTQPTPPNELVIRLQPKEAIYLKTNVKAPGLRSAPIQSELDLSYHSRYPDVSNQLNIQRACVFDPETDRPKRGGWSLLYLNSFLHDLHAKYTDV